MAGRAMNEIARLPTIIIIRRALAALLMIAPLAACSGPGSPAKPPLEGARIGGPFTLTNQDGKQVTDRDFAGKYRIVYFGYTFCPDVCPVDARNIGLGLRAVEASDPTVAAKIVPLFITVDPARDTPEVLKSFVANFHPRMVGLTGSTAAIDATAKEYAIYYKKGEMSPGGGYMVDHSRVAYLMDPQGKPMALLPQDKSPEDIATEIKRWVK
jgi:protein SCO1/2